MIFFRSFSNSLLSFFLCAHWRLRPTSHSCNCTSAKASLSLLHGFSLRAGGATSYELSGCSVQCAISCLACLPLHIVRNFAKCNSTYIAIALPPSLPIVSSVSWNRGKSYSNILRCFCMLKSHHDNN